MLLDKIDFKKLNEDEEETINNALLVLAKLEFEGRKGQIEYKKWNKLFRYYYNNGGIIVYNYELNHNIDYLREIKKYILNCMRNIQIKNCDINNVCTFLMCKILDYDKCLKTNSIHWNLELKRR